MEAKLDAATERRLRWARMNPEVRGRYLAVIAKVANDIWNRKPEPKAKR